MKLVYCNKKIRAVVVSGGRNRERSMRKLTEIIIMFYYLMFYDSSLVYRHFFLNHYNKKFDLCCFCEAPHILFQCSRNSLVLMGLERVPVQQLSGL